MTNTTRTLELLESGKSRRPKVGGVEIVLAPADRPPFAVDATAVEDDTYLVLGADPAYREPSEHIVRVMTAVHQAEPLAPGSVTVGSGHPLPVRVVIHDLSRAPTWTEAWVGAGLQRLLEALERRRLRALRTPPLGGVHGSLPVDRFLALLEDAVEFVNPVHLHRIWLVLTTGQAGPVEPAGPTSAGPKR